jgi:hypothetical protein
MIHLAYKHDNNIFFMPCDTKTDTNSSIQGHIDQHPNKQLVKTLLYIQVF